MQAGRDNSHWRQSVSDRGRIETAPGASIGSVIGAHPQSLRPRDRVTPEHDVGEIAGGIVHGGIRVPAIGHQLLPPLSSQSQCCMMGAVSVPVTDITVDNDVQTPPLSNNFGGFVGKTEPSPGTAFMSGDGGDGSGPRGLLEPS